MPQDYDVQKALRMYDRSGWNDDVQHQEHNEDMCHQEKYKEHQMQMSQHAANDENGNRQQQDGELGSQQKLQMLQEFDRDVGDGVRDPKYDDDECEEWDWEGITKKLISSPLPSPRQDMRHNFAAQNSLADSGFDETGYPSTEQCKLEKLPFQEKGISRNDHFSERGILRNNPMRNDPLRNETMRIDSMRNDPEGDRHMLSGASRYYDQMPMTSSFRHSRNNHHQGRHRGGPRPWST